MAENLIVDKDADLESKYKLLIKQLSYLLQKEDKTISNLSNLVAALKQTFDKISWAGIYFYEDNELYLGPFQGKIACTKIGLGKGVCGTSASKKETIIVPDVNKFPGHIFCDADSKSEIVVPILKDNILYGVLDIDSNKFDSFNEIDEKYLKDIIKFLTENIL